MATFMIEGMRTFLLYHRHSVGDCSASYAAWNGFDSELRRAPAASTCRFGGHEIWWHVDAATDTEALGLLPRYVAARTLAIRYDAIEVA